MTADAILNAIMSMRDMDSVDYTTPPDMWATKLHALSSARIELQIELGELGVTIEPLQTCAEYYSVDRPDLTVVASPKKEG